jgi:uncharacterized membrane protein
LADLHPRQGHLLQRNNFSAVYIQNLSSLHKIVWRSAEKISPFFSTMLLLAQLLGFLWVNLNVRLEPVSQRKEETMY